MDLDPDEGVLSEWERDILHELEWEIETRDPELAATFHLLEKRAPALLARAVLTAIGAIVALTAFGLTVVATVAGLATMGLSLGLAIVPGLPVPGLRKRWPTAPPGDSG